MGGHVRQPANAGDMRLARFNPWAGEIHAEGNKETQSGILAGESQGQNPGEATVHEVRRVGNN